ncbi:hypothetical protein C6502_08920 [Candidatus Poribacteria bacterium]|nr:MAG: hypothetical protein C6502_08920 [Candidatus Poribacteria bacterium]
MAFTVEDYRDLVQLLSERPDWRSELRQLLLSDELLTLPEIVRGLAEAQQRAEVRLANVEDRLSKIETAIQHLTEQVRALTESQRQTENTVSRLKGESLEWSYRNKIYGYFGYLMRRLKVVDLSTIDEALEATLTSSEFRDVFRLDLLATGQLRTSPDRPEVWLAIEISSVVDSNDVDRAWRRADLIRRVTPLVLPVAAGDRVTSGAETAARDQNVVLMTNGQAQFWDAAVAAWIRPS